MILKRPEKKPEVVNCRYFPCHYIRLIVLLGLGLALFFIPQYMPIKDPKIVVLLNTFGSLLIGSSIIDAMFQIKFQRAIQGQVDTLKNNISTLQDTVMIAKGAVEAGLTAVYATREECLEEIKEILEEKLLNVDFYRKRTKERAKESKSKSNKNTDTKTYNGKITISILGISLGDFLCPHGLLQPIFNRILEQDIFHIKVAILKDYSDASYYRAIREEHDKFTEMITDINESDIRKLLENYNTDEIDKSDQNDNSSDKGMLRAVYKRTKCHDELKTATDYLKDLSCTHKESKDDAKDKTKKRKPATLEAYTYSDHPMAFIFVIDDYMFIENYHLAGRGGEAPILQVSRFQKQNRRRESKLYDIFIRHFKYITKEDHRLICYCGQNKNASEKTEKHDSTLKKKSEIKANKKTK